VVAKGIISEETGFPRNPKSVVNSAMEIAGLGQKRVHDHEWNADRAYFYWSKAGKNVKKTPRRLVNVL